MSEKNSLLTLESLKNLVNVGSGMDTSQRGLARSGATSKNLGGMVDFDFGDFDFGGLDVLGDGEEGSGGIFSNLGQLGSLATGLASAYNFYNQNKFQNKAFKFQKGVTNRDIANKSVVINNDLANQAKMQAQMFGNKVGTQEYQSYLANNQQSVDGSAIRT